MAKKTAIPLTALTSFFLLSTPPAHAGLFDWNKPKKTAISTEEIDQLEYLLEATDMSPVENDPKAIHQYGDVWKRIASQLKLDHHTDHYRVQSQISWFSSKQDYVNRLSARASRYIYHTVSEAEKRGLPLELALLPIIESSYDPASTSHASAAGLWQFIPSTGRMYGLEQNDLYDGRRDVLESTRAAYDFLNTLYRRFGSWELALAAYNAGPTRVQQAIDRNITQGLDTDYWSLNLPKETLDYVPRLYAVAAIVKSPNTYGIALPQIANRPHFRMVQLNGTIDFNRISSITGIDAAELYQLNPGFRLGKTTLLGPNRILIPNTTPTQLDKQIQALATLPETDINTSIWQASTSVPKAPPSIPSTNNTPTNRLDRAFTQSSAYFQPIPIDSSYTTRNTREATNATPSSERKTQPTFTPTATLPSVKTLSTTTIGSSTPRKVLPTNANDLARLASQAEQPNINTTTRPVIQTPSTSKTPAQPSISASTKLPSRGDIISPVYTSPSSVATPQPSAPSVSDGLNAIKTGTLPPSYTLPSADQANIKPTIAQTTTATKPTPASTTIPNNTNALSNTTLPKVPTKPLRTPIIDPFGNTAIEYTSEYLEKKEPSNTTESPVNTRVDVFGRPPLKEEPLVTTSKPNTPTTSVPLPTATTNKPEMTTPSVKKKEQPIIKPKYSLNYIVKKEESLTSISRRYNVNSEQIAQLNQLKKPYDLKEGQKITLYSDQPLKQNNDTEKTNPPEKGAARPDRYTVKAGDTLIGIADQFNLYVKDLAEMNDLNVTDQVQTGQTLILNEKESTKAQTARTDKAVDKAIEQTPRTLRVKRGDTLSSIANKYGLTLKQLADLNGVPIDYKVQAGDDIVLTTAGAAKNTGKKTDDTESSKRSATQEYVLKSGDTLTKIAQKHGLSLSELAKLNNIPIDAPIQIGDRVIVPRRP